MSNAVAIAIAIGLATVIVFALIVFAASAPKPPVAACVDPEMREEVRAIMLDGIKDALRRHTVRVYNNWMKDATDQPARARAGMRQGVDAYIGSHKAAHEWNPPRCGEE